MLDTVKKILDEKIGQSNQPTAESNTEN